MIDTELPRLEKIMALCRAQGVESFEAKIGTDTYKFSFGKADVNLKLDLPFLSSLVKGLIPIITMKLSGMDDE